MIWPQGPETMGGKTIHVRSDRYSFGVFGHTVMLSILEDSRADANI